MVRLGAHRLPLPAPARRVPLARRPRRVPRLGAAPRATSRCASAAASTRSSRRRLRHLRGDGRRPRAGRRLRATCSTATPLPDPCSRWQPEGLRGPRGCSTRPRSSGPTAASAPPALARRACIYELHVGTFTPRGDVRRARSRTSRRCAELGVTAIELMPVAEFPGRARLGLRRRLPERRAVLLRRAARRCSGSSTPPTPRGLGGAPRRRLQPRRRLRRAGARGVRPVLHRASTRRPGARAINFDDARLPTPCASGCCQSAEGWIRDFHLDGLRLDAIHAIVDSSPEHLVAAVARRVHAARPGALVIAESGLNDPKVMRVAERGGWGCDAAWADDFHHALRVLLTGDREGYYAEFGSLARSPRPSAARTCTTAPTRRSASAASARRPTTCRPSAFVVFSANHDQVGNRAFGDRLPVEARPLAAFCTLLSPFTPMLFQGEEYGERAPFQFFSRPHRRGDRRRHARGPPARVRRLRRVRRRGGPRPAGPGDLRSAPS